MTKKVVRTDEAPKAVGPYSQAVAAGDYVFCSGQVAIDPQSGTIDATDVAGQMHQAMKNLDAVLRAARVTLDNVVKTTIYLSSMDDFQTVNEVYAGYFTDAPPARVTVEVSRLPLGALVEVDAIARR
jgi:2-iminobutanoate/2-iminopropanoate deaminase